MTGLFFATSAFLRQSPQVFSLEMHYNYTSSEWTNGLLTSDMSPPRIHPVRREQQMQCDIIFFLLLRTTSVLRVYFLTNECPCCLRSATRKRNDKDSRCSELQRERGIERETITEMVYKVCTRLHPGGNQTATFTQPRARPIAHLCRTTQ